MKEEFITLETVKKIEEIKKKKKQYETQQTKINMSIIDANVKLQDENKLLKNDNEILQKRVVEAIEYIENHKHLNWYNDSCYMNDLLEILKGEEI